MNSEKLPLLDKHEARGNRDGCCGWFIRLLSAIHLEPHIFLVVLSFAIEGVFFTNLVQDKLCQINYEYSEDVCDNIGNGTYPEEFNRVLRGAADINMYKQFIISFPNLLFVMIMGPWSDVHGRKLSILLPAFGSLVGAVMSFANAYYPVPAEYMLLTVVPQGILGSGKAAMMMGIWAYTSDVSTAKSKMIRMATVELSLAASIPAGLYLGNVIFDYFYGYLGVYGVIGVLYVLSLLYIALRVKNVKRNSADSSLDKNENCCTRALHSIKEPIMVSFKKRENQGRVLVLSHAVILSTAVVSYCFLNFNFLYSQKMFNWDYHSYTIWNMIGMPVITLGSASLLSVLSYGFHVDDNVIGLIGVFSKMGSFIVMALARQPWHFYLSALVGLGGGMVLVSSRAALSKLLPAGEVGSVFALLAVGEEILPLVSTPILTAIYNYSLTFYPGLIYFFGVGNNAITGIFFIVVIIVQRRVKKSIQNTKNAC